MSRSQSADQVEPQAENAGLRIESWSELLEILREDRSVNGSAWYPGMQAVAMYRLGVWRGCIRNRALQLLVGIVYSMSHIFVRNVYGIELSRRTRIGRRFWIAHQSGIVIHPDTVIGDDCLIRQNVTLGRASASGGGFSSRAPVLGNRVKVGAGAVLVGGISVGDDVVIGPNAVVMTNVPARAIVASPQARIFPPPPRAQPDRPATPTRANGSPDETEGASPHG